MYIPQEIANQFAIAVRDVLWFKDSVKKFLRDSRLPEPVFKDAIRNVQSGMPTIKVMHKVLEDLEPFGSIADPSIQFMFSTMHNWSSFENIEATRRPQARKAVSSLKSTWTQFQFQREREDREAREALQRQAHAESSARRAPRKLDLAFLNKMHDEFMSIYLTADEQDRGNKFEAFMNKLFAYYTDRSEGSFKRKGEQIDGLFYFDGHPYLVEVRWKKKKASAADISVLRDRATSSFGGDTKAVFISFDGFSPECQKQLDNRAYERVILMDGADITVLLSGAIALDVLLEEKLIDLVKGNRSFISAQEIVNRKS